jgi:hypothetical protein
MKLTQVRHAAGTEGRLRRVLETAQGFIEDRKEGGELSAQGVICGFTVEGTSSGCILTSIKVV